MPFTRCSIALATAIITTSCTPASIPPQGADVQVAQPNLAGLPPAIQPSPPRATDQDANPGTSGTPSPSNFSTTPPSGPPPHVPIQAGSSADERQVDSEGYCPLALSIPDSVPVGATTQVTGRAVSFAGASPLTWHVVEPERGTISSDGLLTTTSAGPLHLVADLQTCRKSNLVAIVDPGIPTRPLVSPKGYWRPTDRFEPWGAVVRSAEAWEAFKTEHQKQDRPRISTESIDFARENVIAAFVPTSNDTERAPVVTRLKGGAENVLELVAPAIYNSAPCICEKRFAVLIAAVPVLPADIRLDLVRYTGTAGLPLE